MVKLIIDGINVDVPQGTTILEAAREVDIKVPTLCYHPDLRRSGACGLCIVKVNEKITRACCTPVSEGMNINTKDAEIVDIRRTILELILSKHPNDCLTCIRNGNCELQTLAADFCIRESKFESIAVKRDKDISTGSICLEPSKCILCSRCIDVCQNKQNVWALSFLKRGFDTHISPANDGSLADSPCIKCGQCSAHCPTGAIAEIDETEKVWNALLDKTKHCIIQVAPAVRVSIGDAFNHEPGELLTGRLYTALKYMGFKAVFDTNFGADLTIMEEATEFVDKFLHSPKDLPLITSCCPSWVDYLEKFYPDLIPNFSTCKSPHEMVGALTKTYYAEKMGINPKDIFMVSLMPCTSKKYEISRSKEMNSSGFQDVDVSLTTREVSRMIKQMGIDFNSLKIEYADDPFGEYSGAGTIFGRTGGVMEAALRTAHSLVTGRDLYHVDIKEVQGMQGIRESTVNIDGHDIKIAIAHGTGNVDRLMKKLRTAKEKGEPMPYHFIEVMACPGGCISGGGQPRTINNEIRKKRLKGLNQDDVNSRRRCSHQNPWIIRIYEEFLGKPCGEKSHSLLHTHYTPRKIYR